MFIITNKGFNYPLVCSISISEVHEPRPFYKVIPHSTRERYELPVAIKNPHAISFLIVFEFDMNITVVI